MNNYWFELWEINDIWGADIYANSDSIYNLDGYGTEDKASIAAQSFIDGIKFARGE
jgi:hypothetical protein